MLFNKFKTKYNKYKKYLIAGVISSLFILTGCSSDNSGSSSSSSSATNMSTLTLGCSNFSNSLNPVASPNSAWGPARYGICETLFKFDNSMNALPNLCDSYQVDNSKTVWELHIRDGIKFSNGNDLTASAVKDSLEYLYANEGINGNTNTPSQYLVYDSITADNSTGILTITTSKPYADLTKVLSHVNFIIHDVTTSDIDNYLVGTGPYKVEDNNVGVSILLGKNEHYWNDEVPFENLEIIFMEESTTKSLALQSGDIDICDSITTSYDLDLLRSSSDFNLSETLSARTAFSYINYDGILADDTLREAILLAIDDDTICDITVGGVYSSGYSILPSSLDYNYNNLQDKSSYNLELAKAKLDEAGIVDTNNDGIRELNGEEINLSYVAYVMKSLDAVAEGVTVNLQELGIGVDLKILDSDTHWNMIVNGEFDLGICSWITVAVGDPIGFLENWYSKGSLNYGNYYNKDYDDLYELLLVELDTDVQKLLIEQLQQLLIDDFAIMVHGYYKSNLSSTSQIKGVEMSMSESYWITTDIKPVN
ncbi:MAG: ABC transporter substrate-binding protein [bacterium]